MPPYLYIYIWGCGIKIEPVAGGCGVENWTEKEKLSKTDETTRGKKLVFIELN